jgi:hypothetical protein
VIWFSALTAFLTKDLISGQLKDAAIMTFTCILLTLPLAIVITAHPRLHFASHNTFENVHRWAGWGSLLLFWGELVPFANNLRQGPSPQSLGIILIQLPAFRFLLISSIQVILPWPRFHRVSVEAEHLSNHAVRLHFKEKVPYLWVFVSLPLHFTSDIRSLVSLVVRAAENQS